MDGNYEWQRIRANERVQSRYRDAEAHRLAKESRNSSALTFSLKVAIPLLVAFTVVFWLLAG